MDWQKSYYLSNRTLAKTIIIVDITEGIKTGLNISSVQDVINFINTRYDVDKSNLDTFCVSGNLPKSVFIDMLIKDNGLMHDILNYFL